MGSILPIALFGLAGALIGGAFSMRRQGAAPAVVVIMVVLAVLALAGGVLRLLPED